MVVDFQDITPIKGPVSGTIRPPGSKSITNRALILAALARGRSTLTGVLDSQDTQVMIESLRRLGFGVTRDTERYECQIDGNAGHITASHADLWLENSGTSMRFLTALCAVAQGRGQFRLDGVARMRERPIGDLADALNALGATVSFEVADSQCPPVVVVNQGPLQQSRAATIRGDISSQFLSALLMSLPARGCETTIAVDGELVSKPYVTMTLAMMREFGVDVRFPETLNKFVIPGHAYVARTYAIEPDASAASYFFGAAAISGGRVTVSGLNRNALQGDVHFVDALEQMGCRIRCDDNSITVEGQPLHGIDIDMNAISDTAQTLAAVAVFADSPTTIRNVGHMRHKETDRISALVTELRRTGIQADEMDDGLTVHPGIPQPAAIKTYDDHRMAMSFSLLGLRSPGIRILDPACTAKTYPRFFDDLSSLCSGDFS